MLREWLPFHIGVGVDHFYLYDNGSTDASRAVIEPYVNRGIVTVTDWPENPGQLSAYRHCVESFADVSRWIAFIDLDEFLFTEQPSGIRTVLSGHEGYAGLGVRSYYFGSAGHKEPVQSILGSFVMRASDRFNYKTIANPRWIRRYDNAHFFSYWGPQHPEVVYENWRKERLVSPRSTWLVDPGLLRINHYWSRSLAELLQRKPLRSAILGASRAHLAEEWIEAERHMNAVEDRSILRVAPAEVPERVP